MDIQSLTFLGLVGFGTVTVISFFKPDMDSRIKFALCVLAVFIATFIPVDLGNIILNKVKMSLEVAIAFAGAYKFAAKISGRV